jgi:hypothetical protein
MNRKQFSLWIAMASICMILTASIAAAGPTIAVPVDRYDFGSVAEDDEVVHDFVIRNTGDAELTISQVKTG